MEQLQKNRFDALQQSVYIMLFFILFFYIIIVAKQVLIPISLGFLFATLIYPLSRFFEFRLKIPKTLAILLSVLTFVAVFVLFANLLIRQVHSLAQDFPALKLKANANLEYLRLFIQENFGIDAQDQHIWMKERISGMFDSSSDLMKNIFNATSGTLFKLFLIPVFMFYMLNFREQFQKFIIKASPDSKRTRTNRIMRQISKIIQKYISGVFTVIGILCVLNSVGLYIVGLKYAIVFGIISALFNLIPYFGTWIGAVFPITFALLTGDTPSLAVSVFLMYVVVQFTENNILTPNITGSYVRINPLITILSIIVGGIVWGVAGMLIVIPFMGTIKILFENIEPLKPYALLLGYERPVRGIKRFGKRRKEVLKRRGEG